MKNLHAVKAGNNADQHLIIDDDSGATVALTYSDKDQHLAKIMAAAPRLLAALELIANVDDFKGWHRKYDRAIRHAREAIRAARGV